MKCIKDTAWSTFDSGLKAVSLLKQHSILARNTPLAASFEGSILLCNDYRHASAPARSESWGVVDVQASLLTRQGTAAYPIGQHGTDQS